MQWTLWTKLLFSKPNLYCGSGAHVNSPKQPSWKSGGVQQCCQCTLGHDLPSRAGVENSQGRGVDAVGLWGNRKPVMHRPSKNFSSGSPNLQFSKTWFFTKISWFLKIIFLTCCFSKHYIGQNNLCVHTCEWVCVYTGVTCHPRGHRGRSVHHTSPPGLPGGTRTAPSCSWLREEYQTKQIATLLGMCPTQIDVCLGVQMNRITAFGEIHGYSLLPCNSHILISLFQNSLE